MQLRVIFSCSFCFFAASAKSAVRRNEKRTIPIHEYMDSENMRMREEKRRIFNMKMTFYVFNDDRVVVVVDVDVNSEKEGIAGEFIYVRCEIDKVAILVGFFLAHLRDDRMNDNNGRRRRQCDEQAVQSSK
jgi:hypothetical protein